MNITNNNSPYQRHLAGTSPDPMNIEICRANGMIIETPTGKQYLDMIAGISVCNMGHSHPIIVEAVKKQVEKYMHVMVYGELIQTSQVLLSEMLSEYLPPTLSSAFFVNSGSEAVEGGLKLAKKITGRQEIIHCQNSYHGCTHGAMSVMGSVAHRLAFAPLLPNTKSIRFGEISDLEQITNKTACFIVEPIQGEAGVRIADRTYWQAVKQRCEQTGALLIFDEIQTGMGRTAKLFCFEHYDVVPDILLLAKALGGGMPLGAFISSQKNMQTLITKPILGHISTFGGHPVSCAAALAHLQLIVKEKLWEKANIQGKKIVEILKKLPEIQEIRQIGLMIAADFGNSNTCMKMYKKCLDRGIFTDWFLFCPSALRLAPPLIIRDEDIAIFEERILETFSCKS
jgi:acetylornithine/succinyldiaminopimelate/putrescine aminotransferase